MSVAEVLDAGAAAPSVKSRSRPELVGCKPPPEKTRWGIQSFFSPPDNEFEALPRIAYEKPIWEFKSLIGRSFIISDPVGVKRVLVDNVENYPKTEMERRFLGGTLGEGLLVSEGDKWKSHRRLMAPSFDFKSIVSYAPSMVALS